MTFPITILIYGLLSAASTNALYPTYNYSADLTSHQNLTGFSYEDVYGDTWLTKMSYDVSATLNFNVLHIVNGFYTYDYQLTDVNIDIEFTYYRIEGENQFSTDETVTLSLDFSSLNYITQNNISTNGFYSLSIELSDVADYVVDTALYKQHQAIIRGGFYIPEEADTYFTFQYNFGFSQQLIENYILSASNNDFNKGYNSGYTSGYNTGYDDGNSAGYTSGYTVGYTEGATQDETAVAIFSGIISIALIPINFFLACLNFEVFGINIGAFVSALLTIAIVVIITRMIISGGNGGGDK